MSDENWNFKEYEKEEDPPLFYIEKKSTKEFLEAAETGEVVLEVFDKGQLKQLWYTEDSYNLDAEGYFMLKNEHYHQHDQDAYLTATKSTEIRLKMQGNISLIWIVN